MVSPVPKNKGLPDLMSGDLRWAWGINNRNKVMHLNHPETIPTPHLCPIHGKVVFHKTGAWCQKSWVPLP